MNWIRVSQQALIGSLCLFLVACGGGGGDNNEPPVNDTPVAPVLAQIGEQTVATGTTITLTLSASDGNSADTLTFSISPALTYVILTNNGNRTATLEFNPEVDNVGELSITVTVTDNSTSALSDEETFTLTISDPNGPSVSGIVKDASTSLPIADALVTLQATTTQTTTASDGFCSATIRRIQLSDLMLIIIIPVICNGPEFRGQSQVPE